ncbi:M48 family metalloprotease [Dongia sp.]|uniref:M48 family metalloprotease n=1 Tax=Dongia sp. TaxID=1977262 RepID=UPI00375068D4
MLRHSERRPADPRKLFAAAVILATAAATLAGCANQTSPATGRQFYSSMDPQSEAALGAEEHPKILAEFGGAYDEKPNLNAYVTQLGKAVAANSERQDVEYTFTVLNSEEINAFALPGGYVYITRGLLTLANNEAEVAGVLGHEIGHVTARHTAERYGQAEKAQYGSLAAQILGQWIGGDTGGQLAGGLASEYSANWLGSHSQEQEFEADMLGVRYLGAAQYDTQAMATFLDSLNSETHLEARIAGNESAADAYSMKQSHPRTPERVQRAIAQAGAPVEGAALNRDRYLQQIDGMAWGPDPRVGVIEGRTFIHPGLRFAFEAPQGMKLKNSPDAVIGQSDNAAMIFDLASPAPGGTMEEYVASQWQEGKPVSDVQTFQVNGMEAATGIAKGSINNTPVAIRMVAIRQSETVYRFMYATPPANFNAADRQFIASAQSFRGISAEEASGYAPKRIRVVTVREGDTVDSLSQQMQIEEDPAGWFRVLNHLGPSDQLKAGQKVKLVVTGNAQISALPEGALSRQVAAAAP